MLRAPAGR